MLVLDLAPGSATALKSMKTLYYSSTTLTIVQLHYHSRYAGSDTGFMLTVAPIKIAML